MLNGSRTLVASTVVSGLVAGVLALGPVATAGIGFSPGSVGIGDRFVPGEGNGGYQVRSYRLHLRFDPDTNRLEGVATIRATATQNLSGMNFDLYGLHVDSVVVDGGRATFRRAPRELSVQLASGITDHSRFTAVIAYHGKPQLLNDPHLGRSGWFNTKDGAIVVGEPEAGMFWFPVNEHPSDKARIAVRVAVPNGLRVVSNGLPTIRPVTKGRWTTFHWASDHPMASYLATIAIGKWRVDREQTNAGIPVLNYVDPSLPLKVDRALDQGADIINFLSAKFGPYPFASAGGIADNYTSWYALENQTRPTYDRGTSRYSGLTATVAHELAHQWYGDSVSLHRWRDIWLNEGFATYGEWLWTAHDGGLSVSESFDRNYSRPASSSFWNLTVTNPGYAHLFDGPVYSRGAMTLYALSLKVGTKPFLDIMRAWASEHADANGRTRGFERLAEQVSGQSLDTFFHDWLVRARKPADPR